jgi:hypothetical protein
LLSSRSELESIGQAYRRAYLAHDPSLAPFSAKIRFSENNVEMGFPDGTWDTVSKELGNALIVADEHQGAVGLFLTVFQLDTPSFLAVRLKVERGAITESEHILSTRRNVSGPPEPFGNASAFQRNAEMLAVVPVDERLPRAQMIRLADAYFETLQNNTGELRGGIRFTPGCLRHENGLERGGVEADFRKGPYRANDRVRDRAYVLVDEERSIVMARGFIDHKGVLDEFTHPDGSPGRSIFREPHTWALLELFKIRAGMISAVEAVFYGAPYYQRAPWT